MITFRFLIITAILIPASAASAQIGGKIGVMGVGSSPAVEIARPPVTRKKIKRDCDVFLRNGIRIKVCRR